MYKVTFVALIVVSVAFAQTTPLESVSGSYQVLSCVDKSVTAGSAGNLCDSKTVFVGKLPGDNTIGARFVDVDYVVFNAKCGDPVICSEQQIFSERLKPEFPNQKLTTVIQFTPQQDGTLKIQVRRQLLPKKSDQDLDADVEFAVKTQARF